MKFGLIILVSQFKHGSIDLGERLGNEMTLVGLILAIIGCLGKSYEECLTKVGWDKGFWS